MWDQKGGSVDKNACHQTKRPGPDPWDPCGGRRKLTLQDFL